MLGWSVVCRLDWILPKKKMFYEFSKASEFNPVKLEAIKTVILPPLLSVLFSNDWSCQNIPPKLLVNKYGLLCFR